MVRVFVTVGTDHHPFDRLLEWTQRWADRTPDVELVVQHGQTRPGTTGRYSPMLPRPELLHEMRAADVVVAQGGPGGVVDARACGKLPVVVPRRAELGEHVDDHQVAFARHLDRTGHAVVAEDEAAFVTALTRAVSTPEDFRVAAGASPTAATAATVDRLLADLVARKPPRRRASRRSP